MIAVVTVLTSNLYPRILHRYVSPLGFRVSGAQPPQVSDLLKKMTPSAYSYLSAAIGSTLVARRAGR